MYDEKPFLPYIEAMSKELLMWHTIMTPIGFPQRFVIIFQPRLTAGHDQDLQSHVVGAAVIPNAWAILHNPEMVLPVGPSATIRQWQSRSGWHSVRAGEYTRDDTLSTRRSL
ncbi:hypothetical protein EI94DRAFT_572735 [Lactarius quietus]|nr:hypothetical protein EI94DRAFT_572735 [Lactarius quietus]